MKNKKYIISLLIFMIITFCYVKATENNQYVKIFTSHGWITSEPSIGDYNKLLCEYNPYRCEYVVVNNHKYCSFIDSLISRKSKVINNQDSSRRMNYRLLALVANKNHYDTVAFDLHLDFTLINSKFYQFDMELFQAIINKLPYEKKIDIDLDLKLRGK